MSQLKVTPQAIDYSSDTTAAKQQQQTKPLRSALRSTETKVLQNDVPSKSAKNKSTSPMPGRKVDRTDIPPDRSDSTAVGGGTTLPDLKRQRQSRSPPDSSRDPQSLVVKSTTGGVGNGDVSSRDYHEPRLRLTSPEFVTVEEKQEHSCCVII